MAGGQQDGPASQHALHAPRVGEGDEANSWHKFAILDTTLSHTDVRHLSEPREQRHEVVPRAVGRDVAYEHLLEVYILGRLCLRNLSRLDFVRFW